MLRNCLCALGMVMIPAIGLAQTTTYTYDALGRLTGSEVKGNGSDVTTGITYDPAGNRKTYTVTGAANSSNDPGAGASAPATRRFIVVPLNGFTLIPIG